MLYIWRISVLKTYCNVVDQSCGRLKKIGKKKKLKCKHEKDKWQAEEIINNRNNKRNNNENKDERKLTKNEKK